MARRLSLLSGLSMLGLMSAVAMPGVAAAGELVHSHPFAKPLVQGNIAPVRQNTVSTAVSVGSNALAAASNQTLGLQTNSTLPGRNGAALQFNHSPTIQTAVGAAISVGGSAAAAASNNGPAPVINSGIGPTGPVPLLSLGPAPSTSTAVSTAVTINGVQVPVK